MMMDERRASPRISEPANQRIRKTDGQTDRQIKKVERSRAEQSRAEPPPSFNSISLPSHRSKHPQQYSILKHIDNSYSTSTVCQKGSFVRLID